MQSVLTSRLVPSLVLTALLVTSAWAAAAVPVVRVGWSMEERYGLDEDGDGIVDAHDTVAEAQPESWRVRLDACATTSSESDPIASFQVDVDGTFVV